MRIGTSIVPADMHDFSSFARTAADAHRLGLAAVWTNQFPGGWDPLATLASFGDAPAELGTAVVPTYPVHPLTLATSALTTQALTGGRLTLGLGPGHPVHVEGRFGLRYTAPARHTREYLEVLRPLLRGEHVEHRGEFFTVDAQLAVTAPAPPVLLAALGPRMLAVARDLADGVVAVWVRPDTVADYLVPNAGPGRRVAAVVLVAVTAGADRVRGEVAAQYGAVRELPAYAAVLDRGGLAGPADTVVAGDEDAVLAALTRFADAGLTDLIVSPYGTAAERRRVLDVIARWRT